MKEYNNEKACKTGIKSVGKKILILMRKLKPKTTVIKDKWFHKRVYFFRDDFSVSFDANALFTKCIHTKHLELRIFVILCKFRKTYSV